MTAPGWLPTARALAAVWDGPPLVQHVVSEGAPVLYCSVCRFEAQEADDCPECGAEDWQISTSYPDADTVPDLDSDANGGTILGRLGGYDARQNGDGGQCQVNGWDAETLAHAAARAFVVSR